MQLKVISRPGVGIKKTLRIMKLFGFFVFILGFTASGAGTAQKVTLSADGVSLQFVFKEIKRQTGYVFFYDSRVVKNSRAVSIHVKDEPLQDVLRETLDGQNLDFSIERKTITVFPSNEKTAAPALTRKASGLLLEAVPADIIRGRVTDETGNPLGGVSVLIKGTSKGTSTDADGRFSLDVNRGDTLEFTFVGYSKKTVVLQQMTDLNVVMEIEATKVSEIVVTALGVKRDERALGYAVQSVSEKGLTEAKTVDVGTKLTGKVAGLNVRNSTEFNAAPALELRGASPLLVIDGVPFANLSLRDVAPDDIESISVLKGASASALYGSRGGNGAIMITTKRANRKEGLDVTINSSSMFASGFLAFPEVQTSYSSGSAGVYRVGDYVWGDKLDIGRTAPQYNPFTYEIEEMPLVSKGKNNLDNFLQSSYILNNNISISKQVENASVRSSFTYVRNKGQYPNTQLNKFTASLAGNVKAGNFDLDAGFTYNKRYYPNNIGTGYGGTGYLYNLVVWSGTEFDIRDYKNYWIKGKEDYSQNWMDKVWYSNPYFIANEMLNGSDYNFTNAFVTGNYKFNSWLKATVRSGVDYYSQINQSRNPIGTVGNVKGSYSKTNYSGFSINNDLLLQANHRWGKFGIDALAGGTIYYWNSNSSGMSTQNGLSVPGFYSIYASVDPASVSQNQQQSQVNSLYGKATLSWGNDFFVDVTGRNDWNATLTKEERSYFYPSVAASWILSETFNLPSVFNLLKLRGAWTQTKAAPSVYEINAPYDLSINAWDGLTAAYYPTQIRSKGIRPQAVRSLETGLAAAFLDNRLKFDFAYYNNLSYDAITAGSVSGTSGFNSAFVNTKEEILKKGFEVTVAGTPVQKQDWAWDVLINWSKSNRYYNKLDPDFSTDFPWIKEGSRWDWVSVYDYERAPDGSIIHSGGYPVISKYETLLGHSDPDFILGVSNNIRYKDFNLSFSIDGRVGGIMFNTMNQALWNSGSHIDSDNKYRYDQVVNDMKNYVGEGVVVVSGGVQRDSYGNIISGTDNRKFEANTEEVAYDSYMLSMNPYIGNQRIQNFFAPTFFKLRDVSISYTLPQEWTAKAGIRQASVGLVGQNLLIWTKEFKYSDPDTGSDNLNSPSVRYLGFNIQLSF